MAHGSEAGLIHAHAAARPSSVRLLLRPVQAPDRARHRLHRASPASRSRPGRRCPAGRSLALALAVTLASAAAGAFNQYRRARSRRADGAHPPPRLRDRPAHCRSRAGSLPSSRSAPPASRWPRVAVNPPAALYTFLGAFTYGVVYTVWLKRRTWWNIVIGGLAGSFAVLAGAAAVAPDALGPLPLAFAVVLFLWTPPHFWSLAIAFRDDYEAARRADAAGGRRHRARRPRGARQRRAAGRGVARPRALRHGLALSRRRRRRRRVPARDQRAAGAARRTGARRWSTSTRR